MYIHMNESFRKIGRNLFRKEGNAFVHCAIVPLKHRSINQAVRWFLDVEGE